MSDPHDTDDLATTVRIYLDWLSEVRANDAAPCSACGGSPQPHRMRHRYVSSVPREARKHAQHKLAEYEAQLTLKSGWAAACVKTVLHCRYDQKEERSVATKPERLDATNEAQMAAQAEHIAKGGWGEASVLARAFLLQQIELVEARKALVETREDLAAARADLASLQMCDTCLEAATRHVCRSHCHR